MVGGEITPLIKQLDESLLFNVSNFEGVIAIFLPSVENVGSQIQIRSLSEKYDYIKSLGWELVIITDDTKESLELFNNKYELPYKIYSANGTKIAEKLDILGEIGTIRRTTVLFNREFEIIKRFYDVIPGSHHHNILNWIESNPQNKPSYDTFNSGSGLEEA